MPPVQGKKVIAPFHNDLLNLCQPWKHFSYFEFTEVMRQKDNLVFIDLLSNIKIGTISAIDIALISSRSCA